MAPQAGTRLKGVEAGVRTGSHSQDLRGPGVGEGGRALGGSGVLRGAGATSVGVGGGCSLQGAASTGLWGREQRG